MDCKAPTCVYNEKKNKCQKPNPYIMWLSKCRKTINSIQKCKDLYSKSITKHKKNACDYYLENSTIKKSTCPRNRLPIKDKCPKEYPNKKLNKNNDECCFKERKKVVKMIGIKVPKQVPISPRKKPEYMKNEKMAKIIHKYQNRAPVNKISK